MPYQRPFIKMTLSGTTCAENEIFNTGLHIANAGSIANVDEWFDNVVASLPDLAQVWVDNWDNAALRIPFDAFLTQVKVALIGTDGLYMRDAVEFEVEQFGSYNGPYSPQDARVVTFDSGKRKDPGKYNRMYIPSGGNIENNAYQLTLAQQTAYGTAFKTIIDGLNSILNDGPETANGLVAVISSNGPGYDSAAQLLRIGSLVDTQRRRRNKLPENYVNVDLEL